MHNFVVQQTEYCHAYLFAKSPQQILVHLYKHETIALIISVLNVESLKHAKQFIYLTCCFFFLDLLQAFRNFENSGLFFFTNG